MADDNIVKLVPREKAARAAAAKEKRRKAAEHKKMLKTLRKDTVETLAEWLEMAKKGEIVAITLVALTPDSVPLWETSDLETGQMDSAMLGGLSMVQHALSHNALTLSSYVDEEDQE